MLEYQNTIKGVSRLKTMHLNCNYISSIKFDSEENIVTILMNNNEKFFVMNSDRNKLLELVSHIPDRNFLTFDY
jgi:hypothetical protein